MTEEALLDFVSKSFRSVWPMELLSVLTQEPRQAWQADALSRELRATRSVVAQGLAALQVVGLVAPDAEQAYRFDPASPELAVLAAELTDLYSRKPRAVMRAIFSAPKGRIQTFADAFRLRTDPC